MQVRVQINEQGALRNQRYAFSDRYTLVSELMQNARRAGASHVQIDYAPETRRLTVTDDGCGIADFQKLLSFNDSGWDADTRFEERPFGIGFSKCLYSATRCVVRSLGQQVDFQTETALKQSWIDVVPVETASGAQITLHDVDLPLLQLRIQELAKGFAIPVVFDGKEVPRPHAPGELQYVETEIGQVWLAGVDDGDSTHDTMVYLQGFCVLKPSYCPTDGPANIVHLDSKRFMARLPDRDQLIDEEDQKATVSQTMKRLWGEVLMEKKRTLNAVDFVETFFRTMQSWGHLDLLNDVPVLPRHLCFRIVGYPFQEGMADRDYLEYVEGHITREAVEQASEALVDLNDTSERNLAYWMYARAHGFVVFANSLPEGHWVNGHVRCLEDEAILVEILGEQCRAEFVGRWVRPTVVMCDAYVITMGGARVEIDDAALYYRSLAIIPRNEASGAVCGQISSYTDEHDQHFGDDHEADVDALRELIRRLRAVDPESTLQSLLADLNLENYPLLRGKTFTVRVGTKPEEHGTELVS
jgi:hypothetical protein